MSFKNRVIIIGSFGGNNFGDKLVLLSAVSFLKQELKIDEDKLVIPSTQPSFIKSIYPKATVLPLKLKDTWGTRFLYPKLLFESIRSKYLLTTAGILFDYKFWNIKYNFLLTLLPLMIFSKFVGVKIIGFHVGVSPSSNSKYSLVQFLYRLTLRNHNKIITRDKGSFIEALNLKYPKRNIQLSYDIVFYLLKNINDIKNQGKKVYINITDLMFKDYGLKWYRFNLSEVLNKISLLNKKLDLVFFSTEKNDTKFLNTLNLEALWNYEIIDLNDNDPNNLHELFDQSLFAITSRMHATIITTSLNIPTITFNYHPKVFYYMQEIEMEKFALNSLQDFDRVVNIVLNDTERIKSLLSSKLSHIYQTFVDSKIDVFKR